MVGKATSFTKYDRLSKFSKLKTSFDLMVLIVVILYLDEDVLSHLLLNCKNSLEKAKVRLEMYMNTKAIMPEIFRNRNPFDKEIEEQTQRG